MGAQLQKSPNFIASDYSPPLQEYKLKHCGHNYYVWDHCLKSDSLIEFPINILNQNMLKQQIDMFMLRHRHPILVSTLYFRQNQNTGKASIFYERVFTNLSRIKDLPFQDSLQFYYISLKGFQMLYKKFGYFDIEQEMFHITQSKRVKVWCHKDISKQKPKQIKHSKLKGSESEMVKKIIRIIEQNSDNVGNNYPIGSILYEQGSFNFNNAMSKLRQICSDNNFTIPNKLKCLEIISHGEVGSMLDEFGQVKQSPIFSEIQNSQNINHVSSAEWQKNLQNFSIKKQFSPNFQNKDNFVNSKLTDEIKNKQSTVKPSRKPVRGLQVSHSLQKLHGRNNIQQHNQNVFQGSPIKNLQKQGQKSKKLQFPSPILQNHPNLQFERPCSQKFVNMSPHLLIQNHPNNFVQKRVSMDNCVKPAPLMPHQHLVRRISVDNINRSTPSNQRVPQRKIVINFANRPPSTNINFHKPPSNCIVQATKTNLLNPSVPFPFNAPIISQQPQRFPLNLQNKIENYSTNLQKFQNSDRFNSLNRQKQNENPATLFFQNGLKHRDTFISNLSQYQKSSSIQDYSQFKTRFQQYKKSFNGEKVTDMMKKDSQNIMQPNIAGLSPTLNKRPFFVGILKTDTVTSCIQSNGFGQGIKINESNKDIKSDANQFPSATDVSDNVSYFPNKEKADNLWRQESLVIKHDPNCSKLNMPESKKYEPRIDEQIWADMIKIKNKAKQLAIDQKV